MLKIFRTDIFTQAILIVLVAVGMWVGVFINPRPIPVEGGGPIFYWLTGRLSPLWGAILSLILVLVEAFLLSAMLYRYKLIPQNTMMPSLFYVIAMGLGSPTLTPLVLGNLFLIFAIGQMMLTSTLLSISTDNIFASAALLAFATLLCPPMVVFFVPLFINMFNYSIYGWREWTVLILGILAPYIFVETIYYLEDTFFYRNYLLLYNLTDYQLNIHGNPVQWVYSVGFAIILLIGLGASVVDLQSSTVNLKKNCGAMLIFIIGGILYCAYASLVPLDTQAFATSFACCATSIFLKPQKKEFLRSLIFFIIIAAAITLNII